MKRIWIKDILMSACIILICVAMLCGTAENRRQRRIINEKIDALASRTDAGIQNLGRNIAEMDKDVQIICNKAMRNEDKIASLTDAIEKQRMEFDAEIEDVREQMTTEQTTEQIEEPIAESDVEPYKVGAISIMKIDKEHGGIMEIDDEEIKHIDDPNPVPTGPHLTKEGGVFTFEGHTETYYNLDMSVVVSVAQSRGIAGEYHVRSDGAKMLGDYVMVAACYDVHPYGSLVNTSLGMGIVVDTGAFTAWNAGNIDLAVAW